ncbi:MAG: YdiU family protein [Rhodobacteraceae bacterium]|nr:YdiU family protein [Paracoccaceae bacterium]
MNFDNTYFRNLVGFYSPVDADSVPAPNLLCFNHKLGTQLNLEQEFFDSPEGAQIFSGNLKPDGSQSLSQVYAGHQFGGYSPQLGDGRAVLLGEVMDVKGERFDIQLKGSGRTPYSRGGDGKAAVGPVLREYIISEAMHALGIPTTRSLAAVSTGESVYREARLPGAVLTRVASSHLRVGTFQFIASKGDNSAIKKLADYAIDRHYKDAFRNKNPYLEFLKKVSDRQASLVAMWMNVGFIHGVMNTDNMTISGETIDYGPCAFMDTYDSKKVFSSIDTNGRYSFKNQPYVAQWNIARLAETLLPLIDEDLDKSIVKATDIVESFNATFDDYWLKGMRLKLGITNDFPEDQSLAIEFLEIIEENELDFTKSFLILNEERSESFLNWTNHDMRAVDWLHKLERRKEKNINVKKQKLVNPIFIPRNHLVEEVIAKAYDNDLTPLKKLIGILYNPYERSKDLDYFANPPEVINESYKTFCGT